MSQNQNDPKYQRFEITDSDSCNQLLPSNKINSNFDFYKITVFEYSLTDELLEGIDFTIPVQNSLPLALPIQVFAPSEKIHERSQLTTIESINKNLETPLAFNNFGTFFPVKDFQHAEDELIHKIVLIGDLKDLECDNLHYRGKKVKALSPEEKSYLLQRGYYFTTLADETQQRVKIVLLPDQEVDVTDLSTLQLERKIRIGENDQQIEVSENQLQKITRGHGGFAVMDNKPIWLRRKKITSLRNPGLDLLKSQRTSNLSSTSGAWVPPPIVYREVNDFPFLDQMDQTTFCLFLDTALADKRTPEHLRISSDSVVPEYAAAFKSMSDSDFLGMVMILSTHPRAKKCAAMVLQAPQPELAKYEIGVVSRYEQEWELLGYSKGSLISSINLAPREEMQIEVFSWDKHKLEKEKEFGTEYEFNREINNLTKADTTITRDMKDSLNARADANLNINLPTSKVSGGGGARAGGEWATEEQFATDVNLITESSVKSAEKFKATHRVKIVETHEFGEENRTIRKIQNPNASRTLTFNYFEILENYQVTTRLTDASLFCLLVENPALPAFDLPFVMAYEYRLQQVLLSSNYKAGFDAARILAAQNWFDEESAIEEGLNRPNVGPNGQIPTDGENNPNGSTEEHPVTGIFATAQKIAEILEKEFINLDVQKALITLSEHYNPLTPSDHIQKEVQDAQADISKYCFWIKLTNIYPGFDQSARSYVDKTGGKFGMKSEETNILSTLKALVDLFDDDWLYTVKMVAASTVMQGIMKLPILVTGPFAPVVMGILEPVILPLAYKSDDKGLSKAIGAAKKNLKPIVDTQNSVIAHEQVEMPGVEYEQVPAMPMQVPQLYSYRELAEAHANFTKLISHLEEHRTYYANEIWRVEDENERYLRLEALGIARFVENRLLGFAGNKAVYPLIEKALPESFTLDPFRQDIENNLESEQRQKAELIAVPTAGVHMDTILGQCDALESYLHERREIDLSTRKSQARKAYFEALQSELEMKRMEKRLEQDPPLLDPPYPMTNRTETVILEDDFIN